MRSLLILTLTLCAMAPVHAQDEERQLGWSNVADLGYVLTAGNTSTSTFSLDNRLAYGWPRADFHVRAGALRIQTTDDPFAVGTPGDFEFIEDTSRELENERYYVNGSYQRNISEQFFWTAGAAWDRDTNAGIDNRSIVFGGVGTTWKDSAATLFKTDYTVTFTRRIDELREPERGERFSELRLAWEYRHRLSSTTTFDSDMVFFAVIKELDDNRFATVNGVTTSLTEVFALRFSLDLRYQNVPALEEIDLLNREGLPVGEVVVRKKKLDSIVKFSFVVTL